MTVNVLTNAQKKLELIILNSEASSITSSDFFARLKDCGLSDEVAIRLKGIAEITSEIGQRVIHIGKLILMKIIEFIKAHHNMAVGIAIGAAIGVFVNSIPWIGPFLAPIAALLGVTVGALAGHRLDKAESGLTNNSGIVAIGQNVIEIATEFFKLFLDILSLVKDGLAMRGV